MHSKIFVILAILYYAECFIERNRPINPIGWCYTNITVTNTRLSVITASRLIYSNPEQSSKRIKTYNYIGTEYYPSTEIRRECCTGYVQIGISCNPVCSPNCPSNSQCTSPGVCTCNNFYRQTSLWNKPTNIQCTPICATSCPANSQCVAPNQCTCDSGYEMSAGRCNPICTPNCPGNSQCVAPNQCTCDSGYEMSAGRCNPICTPNCPGNSFCSSPGNCTCNTGYVQASILNDPVNLLCTPVCILGCPVNGNCVAPNTCTCNAGYKMEDVICRPVCGNGCGSHSFCIAPEQCTCYEGYAIGSVTANSSQNCEPQCTDGCPLHGFCTAPNVCACETGYRHLEKNVFQNETVLCAPICESPQCGPNSICQGPNYCACLTGYARNSTHDICFPVCTAECPNYSTCSAPEQCVCKVGYEMNELETQCNPICSQLCPEHSVCGRPNECLCDEGYRLQQEPGVKLHCEPICKQNCSNHGKCVAPNKCKCFPGYEMQHGFPDQSLCQPICSKGCEHGHCFAPEKCVCDPGYLMGPGDVCTPVCKLNCINAVCVAPEICECTTGYRLLEHSVHECVPKCEPPCVNGSCLAPNICICWQGYEPEGGHDALFQQTSICVPKCHGCNFGNCVAPNNCTCWPNYQANYVDSTDAEKCIYVTSSTTEETTTKETTTTDLIETESTSELIITEDLYSTTFASFTNEYLDLLHISSSTAQDLSHTSIKLSQQNEILTAFECNRYCKCWVEYDDFGTLSSAKCERICADAHDAPCLNLQNCLCNAKTLTLSCNITEGSGDGDYSTEDFDMYKYTCRVRSILPSTTTAPSSTWRTKDDNSTLKNNNFWIWIVSGIILTCLTTMVLVMVWRCLRKRQCEDEYIVNFQQEEDSQAHSLNA